MHTAVIFQFCLAMLLLATACGEKAGGGGATGKGRYGALALRAEGYCMQNNLNTEFFLLADLGIHSGKKRFFIWDFKQQAIRDSFLVSHGCCRDTWGLDGTREKA